MLTIILLLIVNRRLRRHEHTTPGAGERLLEFMHEPAIGATGMAIVCLDHERLILGRVNDGVKHRPHRQAPLLLIRAGR